MRASVVLDSELPGSLMSYQHLLHACLQQMREDRGRVVCQRGSRPVLADTALLQDHDLVDPPGRLETMGDDDASAAVQEPAHGAVEQALRRRVEACRGLIQDD